MSLFEPIRIPFKRKKKKVFSQERNLKPHLKKKYQQKDSFRGFAESITSRKSFSCQCQLLTPVKTLYSAFWSSCWTSSVCLFLLKHQPVLYMPCISSLKLAVTFLSSSLIVLTCFPVPAPFYHCKFPLLHILPSRSLIVKASNMFPGVQPCGTSLVT